MTRYFLNFFVAEPMDEVSEDEARASPGYFELVAGPPAHYRYISGDLVERAIYPDQVRPEAALAYHRQTYPGIALDVTSPLAVSDRKRWRRWTYDRQGALAGAVDYELALDSPDHRAYMHDKDDVLLGSSEYLHDAEGELTHIVHYDAEGRFRRREELD
jgi:hypothetical protein